MSFGTASLRRGQRGGWLNPVLAWSPAAAARGCAHGSYFLKRFLIAKAEVIMIHNVMLDSLRRMFDGSRVRVRQWSLKKKTIATISAPLFVGLAVVIATRLVNGPSSPPCVPNSVFVSEDNITDKTNIAARKQFTKSWTLRNPGVQGLCMWTTEYNVVWIGGPLLANQPTYFLTQNVAPGQDAAIRIVMKAPARPGEYKSIWILRTPTGIRFGDPFWVDIIVPRSRR
jgi:hypothetical protein